MDVNGYSFSRGQITARAHTVARGDVFCGNRSIWEIFGINRDLRRIERKREIVEKQKRSLLVDSGFNVFLFSYNEFIRE